jgi:hypothetical protein
MSVENLKIYDLVKAVPDEAKKPITGGRLSGFTDINPMWRIKKLTEIFGACGVGWYPEILNKEIIEGANGEKCAFVDINLYIKNGDEWSKPIPGTGGSSFIAKEKNGLYTSDECFKMAYTDALSVACKALGVGADVYFKKDITKYTKSKEELIKAKLPQKVDKKAELVPREYLLSLKRLLIERNYNMSDVSAMYNLKTFADLKPNDYNELIDSIELEMLKDAVVNE